MRSASDTCGWIRSGRLVSKPRHKLAEVERIGKVKTRSDAFTDSSGKLSEFDAMLGGPKWMLGI
jgi:hypothetical protein